MFVEKYPVDSDFVQGYLSYFITNFMMNNPSGNIMNDSLIYKRCLNMNQRTLNLANCAARRDNVKKFINDNEAEFNKFTNVATDKCQKELLEAYVADSLNDKPSKITELFMIDNKNDEKLNNLKECIMKNL